MYILGISAFYHDSAVALIKDGKIICALEEERFSRIKHDNSFPTLAINKCLERASITINDISVITYYEKPLLKFERILENIVQDFPFSLKLFSKAIPEWLGNKIKVGSIIKNKLNYKGEIYYIPHHLSHAAATFYLSPFKNAAILTADGVGEYQTTALWSGEGNKIKLIKSLNFPNSLGLLYSIFTSFLGFKVNEDEYKLMGLSAYGKPLYKDKIYQIIDLKSDGSFKIKNGFFNFENYLKPWSKKFEQLFGSPKTKKQNFNSHHKNIASSIQKVTEEIYFLILNHLYDKTKYQNLCIAGGVGLNALANGKIYNNTPFKKCSIFGAAGDSGAALGAALFTWHSIFNNPSRKEINNLKLGTQYKSEEIKSILDKINISYEEFNSLTVVVKKAANLLSKGEIIGWFQDQMEFGPRALGSRSILANPKIPNMKRKVNDIKFRELYRPFAGSVLQEKVDNLFEVPEKNYHSPYMTFCFKVKTSAMNNLIAITHKDHTCRIQTVNKNDGIYYQLIKEFDRLTSTPCILNTSFNLGYEPIVENPNQAIESFKKSKLNYLFIGNFLIKKPIKR